MDVCICVLACILRFGLPTHASEDIACALQRPEHHLWVDKAMAILTAATSLTGNVRIVGAVHLGPSELEMDTIQQGLNGIIIYIQCEKQYAEQFWLMSFRRVQASVLHFYLFLKMIIFAIIPKSCPTLLQAGREDKLTIGMVKLEALVNQILPLLEPLYKFMFHQQFSEQLQLTKSLFAQISFFTRSLPTVKKNKMLKIPKLMQYICMCNPLQTSKMNPNSKEGLIRRKNATLQQKNRNGSKITSEDRHERRKKTMGAGTIAKDRQQQSLQKTKDNDYLPSDMEIMKELQFFRFNEKVRKQTIYAHSKKPTLASLETKQKTSSFHISRSPSHDRSMILGFEVNRLQSKTVADLSPVKQLSVDRRSRNVTTKSRQSKNSKTLNNNFFDQDEDVEHERQQQKISKQTLNVPVIKTIRYSQQRLLSEGRSKGWGVIREYVLRRIVQRKLKKLMVL